MLGETTRRLAGLLSDQAAISGQAIAAQLGCSRAAVWKQIEGLRKLGVVIHAVPGRGYQLQEPLELLDAERIRQHPAAPGVARLEAVRILPVVDSTNSEMLRWADGQRHARAVLAEAQTSGRGRRGHQWHSPFACNLYLSLGWRFDAGMGELGCLPLVTAIAAANAIERLGLRGLSIKWPNDLLLEGRKLGGCLVELQGDVNGPCTAVLGVGVNVRMDRAVHQEAINTPWADLAGQLGPVSRNALAALLLDELVGCLKRFQDEGFAPFTARWRHLDCLAGHVVTLYLGGDRITGKASGLGARGGLLVEVSGTVREYHAGEVTSSPPRENNTP